jgi:hypothetical protein
MLLAMPHEVNPDKAGTHHSIHVIVPNERQSARGGGRIQRMALRVIEMGIDSRRLRESAAAGGAAADWSKPNTDTET